MPNFKELFQNPTNRTTTLVLLLFFIVPLGIVDLTNALLIIFLVHSVVVLKKEDWFSAFKSSAFWLVGGFYILHVLNLFHAQDMAEGGRQLEIKAPFFLAALLVVANKRLYKKNIKQKALNLFVYGTISISLVALIYSAISALQEGAWYYINESGNNVLFFTYSELAYPFMHPGYFATFVGFSIFISLDRLFNLKGKNRIKEVIMFGFLFIMIMLLQGRINILALFAVFGLGGVFYAAKHKMYKLLAIPALAVIALVAVFVFGSTKSDNRFLQLPDFSYDITGEEFNSATYRLAEWTCAADVIAENFWFGTGVGDNRKALLDAYEVRGFKKGIEYKFIAHNQYIETMIATGVVGLAYLLFMLFAYGRLALKSQDYVTLATLVFLAFCMLTESMFERAWAITLFAVFFPFMVITDKKPRETN